MSITGVYTGSGGLNCALNDATKTGCYMPDGRLRVTNVSGSGIYDSSGALRIASIAGAGVYKTNADAIRYSDATADGKTGVQFTDGAIRMTLT